MHNWNITTKTMQPNVVLDCRDTAAVMTIPYITPVNYYTITPVGSTSTLPTIDRGGLNLSVLSPLVTGVAGESEISFSIYIHYENVELAGPLVPQMGVKGKSKIRTKNFNHVATKELDDMSSKPISAALSATAKVATALTAVPFLASIAEPASWVLDGLAGVASFFGYSKPLNNMSPTIVTEQYQRYAAVSDGTDNAYPLALRSDNSITHIDSKTVYEGDEMSFAFLKRVSALTNTVTWSTTQAPGFAIFAKEVFPSNLFAQSPLVRGTKTVQVRSGPPIWYLSNLFRVWRGSVYIEIDIVKTDYHSGRLQLTWTPRPTGATLPTLDTGMYALREIVDIRVGNKIRMKLPYIMPIDYLDVDTPSGTVSIRVLNELRAPETAAQSVQLLIHFSGGEDFELAVPGYRSSTANFPPFSPEMFSETAMGGTEIKLVDEVIGGSSQPPITVGPAEHCVGESFSSIRQLLLRYNQIWAKVKPTGTNARYIWPWFTSVTKLDTTGIISSNNGGDVFSFLSPMYAFYRGGVRVQIEGQGQTQNWSATLDPSGSDGGLAVTGASTISNGGSGAVAWNSFPKTTAPNGTVLIQSDRGMLAATAPYYCRTPVSLNYSSTTGLIPNIAGVTEISQARGVITARGPTSWDGTSSYRSIAEDFQFQYFVGCPPLVVAVPT